MSEPREARPTLPAIAAVVVGLLLAPVVLAGPPLDQMDNPGLITLEAHLEPSDLAPGGTGHVVVKARIENRLHVYADGSEALRVRVLPAKGVTYGLPAGDAAKGGAAWDDVKGELGRITWTEPHLFQDPNIPELDPFPVWGVAHGFELKVPITIDANVAPGTRVGLVFDYSSCNELCYERVKGHEASAKLGAATPFAPSPPPAEAASPASRPKVSAPHEGVAARVRLQVEPGAGTNGTAVVTFEPIDGHHLYLPGADGGLPISVQPVRAEGVIWGASTLGSMDEIHEPYSVRVPFERKGARKIEIRLGWQGCDDFGCKRPETATLGATWPEGAVEAAVPAPPVEPSPPVPPQPAATTPGPEAADPAAEGERVLVLASAERPFPVVHGDVLGEPRRDDDWRVVSADQAPPEAKGWFRERWEKWGLLVLGPIFLIGLGLALTPCVLPIIPLTISVIGGGNPDMPRRRLTLLLSVYVLGLAATYGIAGAVSGALGQAVDVEAAFRIPGVIWGFAIFFLLMAAGMMGVFELQPPAFLEKARGGAQRKSGTIIGSFLLGAMAAVIASPCTGPVIVSMLAFTTKAGDPWLGFALFFALGLGLGAVFFAAGSMNLLLRPGPWMVWVRYVFGILLAGVALYYVANSGLVDATTLFVMGFGIAILAWWAIQRSLVKKEGEEPRVARTRGAIIAVLLILTTGLVGVLTRPGSSAPDGWITIKDVAHLREEVDKAKRQGKAAVVDVWATWCTYCKAYDRVIENDPYLHAAFQRMVRLKIDVEKDPRQDLRAAVGLPTNQPLMAFFDEQGRIRRAADVLQWYGADAAAELKRRVDLVLNQAPRESAAAR